MLQINNLHATVSDKPIIKGLTLACVLLLATPAHAQLGPVMTPPSGGVQVTDYYATCLMTRIAAIYPNGPTGTLAQRAANFKAVKFACEKTRAEVDAKALDDMRAAGVSETISFKHITATRRAIENMLLAQLGLPITK